MTPERQQHFQENLGLNNYTPEQLEKVKTELKEKIDTLKADGSFSGEDLKELVDLLDDKTILSPTEAELKSHLETLNDLNNQIDFLMALVEIGEEKSEKNNSKDVEKNGNKSQSKDIDIKDIDSNINYFENIEKKEQNDKIEMKNNLNNLNSKLSEKGLFTKNIHEINDINDLIDIANYLVSEEENIIKRKISIGRDTLDSLNTKNEFINYSNIISNKILNIFNEGKVKIKIVELDGKNFFKIDNNHKKISNIYEKILNSHEKILNKLKNNYENKNKEQTVDNFKKLKIDYINNTIKKINHESNKNKLSDKDIKFFLNSITKDNLNNYIDTLKNLNEVNIDYFRNDVINDILNINELKISQSFLVDKINSNFLENVNIEKLFNRLGGAGNLNFTVLKRIEGVVGVNNNKSNIIYKNLEFLKKAPYLSIIKEEYENSKKYGNIIEYEDLLIFLGIIENNDKNFNFNDLSQLDFSKNENIHKSIHFINKNINTENREKAIELTKLILREDVNIYNLLKLANDIELTKLILEKIELISLQYLNKEIKNNKDYIDFCINRIIFEGEKFLFNGKDIEYNLDFIFNIDGGDIFYILKGLKNKLPKEKHNNIISYFSEDTIENITIELIKNPELINNLDKEEFEIANDLISNLYKYIEFSNGINSSKKQNINELNLSDNQIEIEITNDDLEKLGLKDENSEDNNKLLEHINTILNSNDFSDNAYKEIYKRLGGEKEKLEKFIINLANLHKEKLEQKNQKLNKEIQNSHKNLEVLLYKETPKEDKKFINTYLEIKNQIDSEKDQIKKEKLKKNLEKLKNDYLKNYPAEKRDEIINNLITIYESKEELNKNQKALSDIEIRINNHEAFVSYLSSGYNGSFEDYAKENNISLKDKNGNIIEISDSKNNSIISHENFYIDIERGTFQSKDGKKITLTQEEIKIIQKSPETAENIINLYESLEKVGLSKLWNFRENIFKSIENTFNLQFDRKDGNYLDERETKILLNSILVSIGEQPLKTTLNMEAFLTEIENRNGKQITGTEKQINNYSETKFENLFIEKFVGRGDMIGFKQSAFEASLK